MTQKDYEGKWGLEDLIPHVILFRILYDYFSISFYGQILNLILFFC